MLNSQKNKMRKEVNWSKVYEKQFGDHKNEMRIRLAELSSTNSWN